MHTDAIATPINTRLLFLRTKKKWNGPLQYEDKTGSLMMLPTDMVLLSDRSFRKHVDVYAADQVL
jgi:cytochrome c peroxidase